MQMEQSLVGGSNKCAKARYRFGQATLSPKRGAE